MRNINDVCDFILIKADEGDVPLNMLKLQKLLFYTQAMHLAFYDRPLFAGRFQAWVHGPVNRAIYDRFRDSKTLYSEMTIADVRDGFAGGELSEADRAHIGAVLEAYGEFTGSQLEEMSHREEPWLRAREGYAPTARCEREIDEGLMGSFYKRQQGVVSAG